MCNEKKVFKNVILVHKSPRQNPQEKFYLLYNSIKKQFIFILELFVNGKKYSSIWLINHNLVSHFKSNLGKVHLKKF